MTAQSTFFNELMKIRLGNNAIKDIILVYEEVKPSARLNIKETQSRSFQDFLERHGLYASESENGFALGKDKGKGCHSNKAIYPFGSDTNIESRYCYVAKSDKVLDELEEVDALKDSDRLGQCLGYPECCRGFYRTYYELAKQKQFDFVLYTLSETEGEYPYDFYNNNASRYFGYSLLSHFPCSFNCARSSTLAEKYYCTLSKYSRKWADMFIYCQQSAIIYTEYQGIFLIKNFELIDGVLRYGKSSWLYSTITNRNLELLGKGDNILIKSKNNFSIRQGDKLLKTFKGENVGLLVFG